jgi:hypothetical protein
MEKFKMPLWVEEEVAKATAQPPHKDGTPMWTDLSFAMEVAYGYAHFSSIHKDEKYASFTKWTKFVSMRDEPVGWSVKDECRYDSFGFFSERQVRALWNYPAGLCGWCGCIASTTQMECDYCGGC